MRGLGTQLVMSLRLYFRNRMALLYGYLFPTVFLLAFWVLYRYDRVPLVRHMGELLTVTILGGACFGLPTTLVGERERGVWRRFKLAPIPTGSLVVSTVAARYVILLTAGLLQLALAMLVGMPAPARPLELWVAFTFASFAFLGLGLVIATLADNVPAVQALGQSIFLPMLIVGGVAVPLTALPDWAQHISAFFPGRYSVEAIQATVNGAGLRATGFGLLALTTIGLAACIAGGRMFRWDSQQRFAAASGRGWLGVALAAWVGVGVAAEYRGYVQIFTPAPTEQAAAAPLAPGTSPTPAPVAAGAVPSQPAETPSTGVAPPAPRPTRPASGEAGSPSPPAAALPAPPQAAAAAVTAVPPPEGSVAPPPVPTSPRPTAASPPPPPPEPTSTATAASWRDVRPSQIDEDIVFTRLPPDGGVVTPIAADNDPVDDDIAAEVATLREALRTWAPGKDPDLVQRVRNVLYVAGVVDVFQWPTESIVPHAVFDQLQQDIPKDDLIKILYWIALHPEDGTDTAVDQMQPLGIRNGPGDMQEVRGRAAVYAVKLLGRITGKRPGR